MTPEEINKLIAERVIGWHEWIYYPTSLQSPREIHIWHNSKDEPMQNVDAFDPYHNISHAMMALEKFEKWFIQKTDKYFKCLIELDQGSIAFSGKETTPQAAICLAIVEAVKGE